MSQQPGQNGEEKGKAKSDVPLERPASVQEDWQVAYTWSFIVKFGLLSKIRGLECLDDFERCLLEPVANRPDDVLEGVCVRFLQNLRPTLRLDCTNIQHHLSKYIAEMLQTSKEFTVWDPVWVPNEEMRGSCCRPELDFNERMNIGRLLDADEEDPLVARDKRNPLKQMEQRGGGLFELDWYERARLLRQLVDWQLTHSDVIRERIKDQKPPPAKQTAEQAEKEAETSIKLEPIGMDRNKKRVWSLDDSARLYQSGNPFKRPCPLAAITTTREQLEAKIAEYAAHGAQPVPKPPKGAGPKGKMTPAQSKAHRALVQGIEHERALAEHLREKVLPKVDAHDKRIAKARRKEYERIANLQAAELRSTRTRRQTRVINYRDLDEGVDDTEDDDEPRRGGRRGRESAYVAAPPARPLIPGERRSARQRGRNPLEDDGGSTSGLNEDSDHGGGASVSATTSPRASAVASPDASPVASGPASVPDRVEDGHANGHHVNGTQHDPIEVD